MRVSPSRENRHTCSSTLVLMCSPLLPAYFFALSVCACSAGEAPGTNLKVFGVWSLTLDEVRVFECPMSPVMPNLLLLLLMC